MRPDPDPADYDRSTPEGWRDYYHDLWMKPTKFSYRDLAYSQIITLIKILNDPFSEIPEEDAETRRALEGAVLCLIRDDERQLTEQMKESLQRMARK